LIIEKINYLKNKKQKENKELPPFHHGGSKKKEPTKIKKELFL